MSSTSPNEIPLTSLSPSRTKDSIYPSPLHVPPNQSPTVSPALTLTTPTHSLPPLHAPAFFENPALSLNNLSRASSLSRIGSDLPPLSSLTPYPPSTPTGQPPTSRHGRPPPIITNFPPGTPLATSPHGPPAIVYGPHLPLREISLVRWRTGHAVFVVGAVLTLIGICVGLISSATTTCKVPYMAYSYYDNYAPFADMECTTHPSGWYAGAPILAIGLLCIATSLYFSWVKVQEMKMAAKYQVAMV
eukprot:Phypoly_transcript_13906.p1 GENE.Phypoly_transcript_13906~~Phypoly_transcript_13906.p1  ORF type:complete len:246 (+),score=55.27 Phypoly_transcript_13906:153-890(+)